jgi:hypothetical protein
MSEPVTLVEIDRDVCSLTFGVSPCPATGTKCYNTWATCAARSAFAVTTQTLRFAKPRADLPLSFEAIPSVISTSASPTELNVGDVLEIESNIFSLIQKITANAPYDEADFGAAVDVCPTNCRRKVS